MVYELYVDSLFLINFVMNLYLLILVDRSCMRTATRMRILVGAGAGAIVYVLAFLIPVSAWVKWPMMFVVGTGSMLEITFRPRSLAAVWRLLRQLLRYSFLIGGLLLFLGSRMLWLQKRLTQISGLLGVCAVLFLLLGYLQERDRVKERAAVCQVKLFSEEACVCTTALVDSGNHLREPVSGKPVSVIGQEVFAALWAEEPTLYRAIPYHSVGRNHGILQGYLLPELEVELDGMCKRVADVYVAVCEEEAVSGMILHPEILSQAGSKRE
ncbi:MAG: sigma-E processing peptidase SpoIIGA [Lachnospiraceae bacterium]|nr:sigma-E processing peptidase SpoIIGA [Lachnospiraceae bacterium]